MIQEPKPKALPKLLIVEDDEGLQRQLRWAYEDYDVTVVGDRQAALDAVRADEPDVVTLDLGLPPDPDGVTEGFATMAAILALKPDTKIIIASGHGERSSAMRASRMCRCCRSSPAIPRRSRYSSSWP